MPYDANLRALAHVTESVPLSAQSADQAWQSVGPNSITQGLIGLHSCTQVDCGAWRTNVSGRTKAIVFNPNNPNTLYVATASGGMWKSTDGGATYTPITDNQPSLAFHSLALDPTNPNIIYAGTGEIQGHYGVGLLKSTNGGQSWTLLGANQFKGLVISAIVIHPTSPNTVWVATNLMNQDAGPAFPVRGVFRSNDGGQTWSPQLTCERCAGVSDLVINSANPQVLYAGAAGFGVFKTTDGGVNWTQLSGGLPDRGFNRVELAIGSGGGANVLYAGLAARISTGQGVVPWGLIYRSADSGASWQLLQNTQLLQPAMRLRQHHRRLSQRCQCGLHRRVLHFRRAGMAGGGAQDHERRPILAGCDAGHLGIMYVTPRHARHCLQIGQSQ